MSPCCFQTSLRKTALVSLEDKQKGKSGGVDWSWILPIFNHDLYIYLESFICIWTLFKVITGSGTYLRKMMYLGQFGDFLRALLETEKESIIESEYQPAITTNNLSTEGSYHRSTAMPPASYRQIRRLQVSQKFQ